MCVCVSNAQAAIAEFEARGNLAETFGSVMICSRCAGCVILPHGVPMSLRGVCPGPSKVASTRDKQKRKLANAARGVHPSSGDSLQAAVPPSPPSAAAEPSFSSSDLPPTLVQVARALRLEEAAAMRGGGMENPT